MKRSRETLRPHRGDDLTAHVRRVSMAGAVQRLRRPKTWSRDDFERWVRLGAHRGYWLYTLEREGDVALLDVLERLFTDDDEGGPPDAAAR